MPSGTNSTATGNKAEKIALKFLLKQGLKKECNNFSACSGEIDLIMRDVSTLVFVEVRFRQQSHVFGDGFTSITHQKQQRIHKTAQCYLQYRYGPCHHPLCRFDVVGISHKNMRDITWIKNAFTVQ